MPFLQHSVYTKEKKNNARTSIDLWARLKVKHNYYQRFVPGSVQATKSLEAVILKEFFRLASD